MKFVAGQLLQKPKTILEKTVITMSVAVLILSGLSGFLLSTVNADSEVSAVTPSTNSENRANGWAHFNVIDVSAGEVDVEFISTRKLWSCFEIRLDNEPNTVVGANPNLDIDDGRWTQRCVNNSATSSTFQAVEYVEIRMVYGAETDERFSWTKVEVEKKVVEAISADSTVNYSDNFNGSGTLSFNIVDGEDSGVEGLNPSEFSVVSSSGNEFDFTHPRFDVAENGNGSYTVLYTPNEEVSATWSVSVSNVSINPALSVVVTIDSTGPTAPTITSPNARSWHKTIPILNQWTASTDDGSGVAGYQVAYQYDEGYSFSGSTCANEDLDIGHADSFIGCRNVTSISRNHIPTISEQGGVTIWARAYDNAGNYSNWSDSVQYYYDNESPTTTISAPTGVVGDGFTVSGDASDNLALNRVYIQLVNRDNNQRYGGTTISLIGQGTSTEWSKTFNVDDFNMPDGNYAAHVSVTDMAGNTGSAGWTENFSIDSTSPLMSDIVMLVNGDESTLAKSGDEITIKANVEDPNDVDRVQIWVRGWPWSGEELTSGNMTKNPDSNAWIFSFTLPETYKSGEPINETFEGNYFNFRPYDSVSNSQIGYRTNFTVDNTAPEVTIDPVSSLVDPGISVTLTAQDVGGDIASYQWSSPDTQLTFTPPVDGDTVEVSSSVGGEFTVELLVADAAGNETTETAIVIFKDVDSDNSNDENQAQRVTPTPPDNQGTQQAAAAGAQGGPVLAAVTGGAQNIGIQNQVEDEEGDEQEVATQQLLGNNSGNNREARNGEVLGITDDSSESSSSATWVWILLAVLGAGSLLLLFARKQVEQEQQ